MIIADKIWGLVRGSISMGFQQLRKTLVDAFSMVTSYHNESMKFARSAGMSLQQANAYTKVLTTRATELGMKYGLAASEVQNLERSLQNAVTRQLMLSDTQAEKMIQINRLVGESVNSTYSEQMVTKMGAQIDTVQGAIAKGYATAMKSGLNAEKMTQKISQNLGMANRLSFRNGVDGLTRMAMLSEKLGVNMQSVETAAGSFIQLDQAIEHAAQLQMLGGSAGAMFGNPLAAAYEANYDPEAFAKRMSDSLASYATFDASKGISNINGMNMDFVRSIAKAMGISAEEAASMAKKQAEVRYKENTYGTTLDAMSGGDQMKRDMLINKSTIQNGKLGMVDSKQQWHEMSYYQSGEGKKEMDMMTSMYGKSDSEIMMEIAMTEKTISEQIQGFFTSLSGTIGKLFVESGIMEKIQNFIDEKGAMIVQKVSEGVDWILNGGFQKLWDDAVGWLKKVQNEIKLGTAAIVAAILIGQGMKYFGKRGAKAGKTKPKKPSTKPRSKPRSKPSPKNSAGKTKAQVRNYQNNSYAKSKGFTRGAKNAYQTGLRNGATKAQSAWGTANAITKNSKFVKGIKGGGSLLTVGLAGYDIYGNIKDTNKQIDEINKSKLSKKEKESKIKEARNTRDQNIGGTVVGSSAALAGAAAGGKLGAAIGTAIAPGLGTAIGGFLGGIIGGAGAYFLGESAGKGGVKAFQNNDPNSTKRYSTGGIVTGGTPGRDSVRALLTPGERVLTKDQYQTLVKPKPTGAKEYIYNPGRTNISNVNGNKITVKDFNVNISGTIKIDAGNSSTNISAASLLRDQAFVNQLKNVIKESINNDMNGGRFMNDLATRRGQTTSSSMVGRL